MLLSGHVEDKSTFIVSLTTIKPVIYAAAQIGGLKITENGNEITVVGSRIPMQMFRDFMSKLAIYVASVPLTSEQLSEIDQIKAEALNLLP